MGAVPYRIHTVLTDNRWPGGHRSDRRSRRGQQAAKGVQFTARKQDLRDSRPVFDRVCDEHGIEHRLTKVNPPLGDLMVAVPAGPDRGRCPRWTNGQVERMNRTLKASSRRDGAVKRYHYEDHAQLRAHLQLFVDAYNHARRLKTLRGLTPYEFVCQAWTKEPSRFRLNPSHHIPGPYT
jgi:Integrase core domain